jgi:hypothetical protein
MNYLLFFYQRPEPATWVFLSSFLLLSIYFVFHRFFSIRNLDVLLLLLLAPGLLMVYEGRRLKLDEVPTVAADQLVSQTHRWSASTGRRKLTALRSQNIGAAPSAFSVATNFGTQDLPDQSQAATTEPGSSGYPPKDLPSNWTAESLQFYGFGALLSACALLLIRMMIDPVLVRRPLLIPNLSIGGLAFIGVCLFSFLMSIVVTSTPHEQEVSGPQLGPGYALLNMLPQLPTTPQMEGAASKAAADGNQDWQSSRYLPNIARVLAVISNLTSVLSIVGIGYWHFDNVKTGIGCAVMYLLLPYTAQMTGNLEHVIPAALMVLALLTYRQPVVSGLMFGLAAGLVYYPMFLLPLWLSFYWKRGLGRYLVGFSVALVLLVSLLLLQGWEEFLTHISRMFGLWLPRLEGLEGIWGPNRVQADYRLPVLVGCMLLSGSYAIWPSRKSLATLISGTAVVMLATQFWHGYGGGLYMAWFLPFVLLTVFRPNLDDRIATTVVRPLRPTAVT